MKIIAKKAVLYLLFVLASSFGAYAGVDMSAFEQSNAKIDCIIAHGGIHSKKASVCFTDASASKVTEQLSSVLINDKRPRDSKGLYHWKNVNGNPAKAAYAASAKGAHPEIFIGKKVHDDLIAMGLTSDDMDRVFHPIFNQVQDNLGLLKSSESQKHQKQWDEMLRNKARYPDFIQKGDVLKTLSFRKGVIQNVVADFNGNLPTFVFPLENGKELLWIPLCQNFAIREGKNVILPVVPEIKKVASKQQSVVERDENFPLEKKSAFYGMKVQIEDGAWLFHGATRHGDWKGGGGEAMLWLRFGKGNQYAVGAGPIGSVSYGSIDSGYKWDEHYVGGQIGFRRDFWDSNHRPTGYAVKVRGLWDHVQGGNTQSGYHSSQNDFLLGGYAEWLQRRGPRWLIGAQAYGYAMLGAKQQSTWSGDRPQDRSSVGVNTFAEYFLHYGRNKTFGKWWLSVRGNLGVSHQFWDNQSIAPISLQLRLGSKRWGVFGCGVQVGLPLGRSAQYVRAGVSWGDLVSRTEFCNYNYGGVVHRLDSEYRVNQVQERHDIKFATIK